MRRPRGRRWAWALAVIAAIAGLLAIVVMQAPDYLARYLVRNYFQGLNIDTSGVETINISLLRGEISFGPVTFKGTDGEPGQVGRIGVNIDVRRLLRKQALVESAVVEGIRIDIRQTSDGALNINGIPLTQILAEQAARAGDMALAPRPAASADAGKTPWGAGLDTVSLRDSRIVFTDPRGGQATVAVHELDVAGFQSWTPESPGHFRLNGDLNGIGVVAEGTATPFADNIGIDAMLKVSGIELAKIELYTGPLGFRPNAGRVDLLLETSGSLVFPDGRVDAQLKGQANLAGFDLANPDIGNFRVDSGRAQLAKVTMRYDASGKVDIDGDLDVALGAVDVRLADGTEMAFAEANIGLPAFTASIPRGGPAAVGIAPNLDIRSLRLGGPDVRGTIALATIRLTQFDLDPLAPGPPFTATGEVKATALDLFIPDKVQPIAIKAEKADVALQKTLFAFPSGRSLINGSVVLAATDVTVRIEDTKIVNGRTLPPVLISASRMVGDLPTLSVDDSRKEGTKVTVGGPTLTLDRFALDAPTGPDNVINLRADAARLTNVHVDVVDTETLTVAGRTALVAPTLTAEVSAAGRQQGDLPAATADTLRLDLKRFQYGEAGETTSFGMQGTIAAGTLNARVPVQADQPPAALNLDGLSLAVADLAFEDGPATTWNAAFGLDLKRIDAMLPGSLAATLEVNNVRLDDAHVASRPEYGFERLNIGRFDVGLMRKRPAGGAVATAAKAKGKVKDKAPTATDKKTPRTWPPPDLAALRIGSVRLTQGGKISIIDQTLSPPALAAVHVDTLSIGNIDSSRPRSRAEAKLKARIDRSELTVDGWAQPFDAKPDFDLRARLGTLFLPALGPFIAPLIGLDIIEGEASAEGEGRAVDGRMNAEVRARLVNLGFADRPEAGTDRISRSIGIPLSTIIDLLEDADGSIDLTLPMEGDLLSPEFDYSDMIWSGIFRVLRALVTAPFTLISASVDLISQTGSGAAPSAPAGTQATSAPPGLGPVPFAAGESAVGADLGGVVNALGNTLRQRPKMRLKLCGVATRADREALSGSRPSATGVAGEAAVPDPRLYDLAEARMKALRQALTTQPGVATAQVVTCAKPHVDADDAGPPRVEFGF